MRKCEREKVFGMKRLRVYWIFPVVIALMFFGESVARDFRSEENPHQNVNPNVEDSEWAEVRVELPEYPSDQNLVEVDLDIPRSRFTYLVDGKTLFSNPEDGTIQYTLVMQSERGGKNIIFETMRCSTMEYKTYAYGDSRTNNWRRLRNPQWQGIRESRTNPYHQQLWQSYFCRGFPGKHYDAEKILYFIRNPGYGRLDRPH